MSDETKAARRRVERLQRKVEDVRRELDELRHGHGHLVPDFGDALLAALEATLRVGSRLARVRETLETPETRSRP